MQHSLSTDIIPSQFEFTKLSASGNHFILLNNLHGQFDALLDNGEAVSVFSERLSRRGFGVGADGVIFASKPDFPDHADIGARFFETDGSECALCGNGTACFTRWACELLNWDDKEMFILTPAGVVRGCRSDDEYIRVCIPTPMDHQADLAITIEGRTFVGDYVNVGIPHFVVPVDDLASLDVVRYGRALRHHEHFKPRGANINFIRIVEPGVIENRTYEFGVEDETMACGTGSSASAVMTALNNGWDGPIRSGDTPVRVMTRSGDELRVYFEADDQGTVHDVCLESIVRRLYQGTISAEFFS